MPKKIVTPQIRKRYKDYIASVIEDLHKLILAHMPPEKVDCPNCQFDLANGKSSGVFNSSFIVPVIIFTKTISPVSFTKGRCPVCRGEGILVNPTVKKLKATVRWNPKGPDDLQITVAGREGAAIVRIKFARKDYNTVKNAEYFTVDGVRCELNESITIRNLGQQEEMAVAFLISTEVGSDTKR